MTRIRLRPTMQSDIDFVLSLEQDEENLPFITPWERMQHEAESMGRAALRVVKKVAFEAGTP